MHLYFKTLIVCFLLAGCGGAQTDAPVFHGDVNPKLLSQWNLFTVRQPTLQLTNGVVPYDLNSSLFTDYAHKLRTVWVPSGVLAQYHDRDAFDFPVGTILSKTFYYPHVKSPNAEAHQIAQAADQTANLLKTGFNIDEYRLIETRLLVHRMGGWVALPYVWNTDQTDATLKRIGDVKPMQLVSPDGSQHDFNYIIPNANQCAGCHATNATTREIQPIGPKARHLNKDFDYSSGKKNQLTAWQDYGILLATTTRQHVNVDWTDINFPLDARARSYLDINCSHCHNPVGPADTSGLHLSSSAPNGPNLGVCKLPIAAGTGTGGRTYDIVPGKPAESIFTFRMRSTNPAVMMPELGRSLSHEEGVALIATWIAGMEGACGKN